MGALQQIAALEELVLVAHEGQRLDVWRRTPAGWAQQTVTAGSIDLHSIGVELPLAEIYRDPPADQR
jgi:hypothetical protein